MILLRLFLLPLILLQYQNDICFAFVRPVIRTRFNSRLPPSLPGQKHQGPGRQLAPLKSSSGTPSYDDVDDATRQWDLFQKHHARGSWRGVWTTYDYVGDVVDSRPAAVVLEPVSSSDPAIINHEHQIQVSSAKSDCETCFDSSEFKRLPVASYQKGDLKRNRCASQGLVCGPSLLRSGAVSTELVLADGDERVRVIFQHAPVWARGIEPNSCPPDGLKLYRAIVSREGLRSDGNVVVEPVPPFTWHAQWSGTSWTWGPTTGDRGWAISNLEEADAWHGRPTGDSDNVWSLRLAGGVLIQCPRILYSGEVGICRLAWVKPSEGRLTRIEGGVAVLEPVEGGEFDDVVGFQPPRLSSLRCDVFDKVGELEGVSILGKDEGDSEVVKPLAQKEGGKDEDDSGLDAVRQAMKL